MADFWKDYSRVASRPGRPVGVTHCQEHHDQRVASDQAHMARGGNVNGYSVKLRSSERARCAVCGASR